MGLAQARPNKFIVPSVVMVLAVLLSRCERKKKTDESEDERARRLMQKQKSTARLKSMRAVASEAKISSHPLRCSKPPGTLSSYALSSFSHFVAHGRPSQKHVPC